MTFGCIVAIVDGTQHDGTLNIVKYGKRACVMCARHSKMLRVDVGKSPAKWYVEYRNYLIEEVREQIMMASDMIEHVAKDLTLLGLDSSAKACAPVAGAVDDLLTAIEEEIAEEDEIDD